jgi:ComF family protein
MLRQLLVSVGQLVLPAHCAACGAAAPPELRMPLCRRCSRALAVLMAAPYCPLCGRRAGPHTVDAQGCMFCRRYPVRFDGAVRVGPYEDLLRTLILRCKRHRRVEIGPHLGRLLAERAAAAPWADLVDEVVPVPLHWGRRVRRGFNQAVVLAQTVAGALAAARPRRARPRLRRTRPTPHQANLSAAQRPRNVRGAFAVRGRARDLAGKRVLLVDDVMTSGTTIAECTRTLLRAGADAVYVAVVATADYDDPGPW